MPLLHGQEIINLKRISTPTLSIKTANTRRGTTHLRQWEGVRVWLEGCSRPPRTLSWKQHVTSERLYEDPGWRIALDFCLTNTNCVGVPPLLWRLTGGNCTWLSVSTWPCQYVCFLFWCVISFVVVFVFLCVCLSVYLWVLCVWVCECLCVCDCG